MKCPKCNTEIKRFDLSPTCKKCGVHIMYYTSEKDLALDAKKTELEFASARLLFEKVKNAFVKGKIQIIRIVVGLLCIASLLIPHYTVGINMPWWNYEISTGVLGVYNIISDGFWKFFDAFLQIEPSNALMMITITSFSLLIITVLAVLVCVGLWFFSFLDIKKTAKGICFAASFGAFLQLGGFVISLIAAGMGNGIEFVTVKPLFGGIVSFVLICVFIVLNMMIYKNPPEVILSEYDKKRLEIKEKIKNGEITYDKLPLPIVDEPQKEEKEKKKKKKSREEVKK